MFISDLDDTLLSASATLDELVAERLNKLIKNGINFSFITARDWESAHNIMGNIKINNPVAVSNGAIIMDFSSGKVIKSYSISHYAAKEIINLSNKYQQRLKVTYCNKQTVYKRYIDSDDNIMKNNNFLSLTFTGHKNEILSFYDRIKCKGISGIKINLYEDPIKETLRIIDIVSDMTSKGIAGQEILRLSGIKQDNSIAFGNDENDIELLKISGLAVGIGEIPNSLRNYVDIHLKYDEGISVLDFIEQYTKEKRRRCNEKKYHYGTRILE